MQIMRDTVGSHILIAQHLCLVISLVPEKGSRSSQMLYSHILLLQKI